MQTGKEQWQKHSKESADKIEQMKGATKEIIGLRERIDALRQRLGKRPAAGKLSAGTSSVPEEEVAPANQLEPAAQPVEPTPATSGSGPTEAVLDQSGAGAGAAATPQNETNVTPAAAPSSDASNAEVKSAKAEGEAAPAESNGDLHPEEIDANLHETDAQLSEELLVRPPGSSMAVSLSCFFPAILRFRCPEWRQ